MDPTPRKRRALKKRGNPFELIDFDRKQRKIRALKRKDDLRFYRDRRTYNYFHDKSYYRTFDWKQRYFNFEMYYRKDPAQVFNDDYPSEYAMINYRHPGVYEWGQRMNKAANKHRNMEINRRRIEAGHDLDFQYDWMKMEQRAGERFKNNPERKVLSQPMTTSEIRQLSEEDQKARRDKYHKLSSYEVNGACGKPEQCHELWCDKHYYEARSKDFRKYCMYTHDTWIRNDVDEITDDPQNDADCLE